MGGATSNHDLASLSKLNLVLTLLLDGYVVHFEPDAGAQHRAEDHAQFGLGGSVILDLMSELPPALPYIYHLTTTSPWLDC